MTEEEMLSLALKMSLAGNLETENSDTQTKVCLCLAFVNDKL